MVDLDGDAVEMTVDLSGVEALGMTYDNGMEVIEIADVGSAEFVEMDDEAAGGY